MSLKKVSLGSKFSSPDFPTLHPGMVLTSPSLSGGGLDIGTKNFKDRKISVQQLFLRVILWVIWTSDMDTKISV